jgi:hypothetical protein
VKFTFIKKVFLNYIFNFYFRIPVDSGDEKEEDSRLDNCKMRQRFTKWAEKGESQFRWTEKIATGIEAGFQYLEKIGIPIVTGNCRISRRMKLALAKRS